MCTYSDTSAELRGLFREGSDITLFNAANNIRVICWLVAEGAKRAVSSYFLLIILICCFGGCNQHWKPFGCAGTEPVEPILQVHRRSNEQGGGSFNLLIVDF